MDIKNIEQITVKTKDREYPVYIGKQIMADFFKFNTVQQILDRVNKITIVCDDITARLFYKKVCDHIKNTYSNIEINKVIIPHGESSKNIENYSTILEHMAEAQMTRSDILLALGGGVVGDIAGFAAATYLRGIDFIQVPTTILAAVDSSVGGKTAINLATGKNLAGAFWQPSAVICDIDSFSTLDDDTKADGISEIIKYGVLKDEKLFSSLEKEPFAENVVAYIKKSVEIKSQIVESDERESGQRKLLNYGHTMGHAIEKLSSYRITHGHAVAIGMAMITRISDQIGISHGIYERLVSVLKRHGLPTESPYDAKAIFEAALTDKKRSGNSITLVMPERIGKCILHETSLKGFEHYLEL